MSPPKACQLLPPWYSPLWEKWRPQSSSLNWAQQGIHHCRSRRTMKMFLFEPKSQTSLKLWPFRPYSKSSSNVALSNFFGLNTLIFYHSDYRLTILWLHSDILNTSRLHSNYIHTVFWLHSGSIRSTTKKHDQYVQRQKSTAIFCKKNFSSR